MADKSEPSPWLAKAQEAYESSTSFVDSNYRTQWEDNIRAFQNRHHSGSKYNTAQFKYRSKVFRPKTRASIRSNEAAAAAAFFTNPDVVSITAEDPSNPMQQASAEIMQELLQYRLTKTIPWFITLVGAFQDAEVIGVVASFQSWKYEERETEQLIPIPDSDEFISVKDMEVVKDQPDVEILPVENIRIHPASDWRDPIRSSPYMQILWPMYALDVRERMKTVDEKTGQPKWKKLSEGEMRAGLKLNFDPTKLTRENDREDKYSESTTNTAISDYDIIWVIENFMRDDKGQDMQFYTLGTQHMLSDAKPIDQVYFTGERPVAMGASIIETHKIYPAGVAELGQNIQRELNEIANQRLDNVKLVLNKRYFAKRGAQVDLQSILRNVPGSVTLMTDPMSDVREFDFNDVTGSAYEEQSRLSTEYDELVGNFSQSSVMNNRKLNETVGGMQMLRAGSIGLTEYLIRTFAETWVKDVMWQLIKLEQKYETDMVLLSTAAQRIQLFQRYGIDEITDELLNQELTMEVNVGIGATDPVMKLNQFLTAMEKLTVLMQNAPPGLNIQEVQKEIFGRLGHKDGARFFKQDEQTAAQVQQIAAQLQQSQQVIAQLQAELQQGQADNQTKVAVQGMKEENANLRKQAELETQVQLEQIKLLNPVPGERVQ